MAAINDLINQIDDEELKKRITQELEKLTNQKKFGLVFEEHLPECVPLYDMPIRRGSKVAQKAGKINETYTVMQVEGENVYCTDKKEAQLINFLKKDLVPVAEFGEPIYPYLKQVDSIYKSDDKELPTHALIQADNYHALQLLEYLYAGKVDCIYIDPPYNTGARDWKYNNDYVDSSDTYRHSKWLSMMKKRLLLAKKLLNPADSVMIVTIDEKEYLHLGCLLEELFPEANIQMITVVINPKGRATNYFTRTDEYVFFLFFGNASVVPFEKESGVIEVRWPYLKRSDADSTRGHRPRQFYPIYINDETEKIHCIGEPISADIDRETVPQIDGCTAVFPISEDGTEMEWGLTVKPLKELNEKGFVRVGKKRKDNPMPYSISYLSTADVTRVEKGILKIVGEREDGTKIVVSENGKLSRMQTVWTSGNYDAGAYGKTIIGDLIPKHLFSYPKSLYAVHDTLKYIVANKPNALIIDFFAGSGTTLHAVNLLNAEDGGKRQCIMVTNNEVSDDESKQLLAKGLNPGDEEWEKLGIANYVTWPRTVCSINGKDINGNELKGNYIGSDIPMANGFNANAVFFKLGFLDKTSVQLGRQFKELLPLLWLKAGGWGKCPDSKVVSTCTLANGLPPYIILPENRFAVLIDEKFFSEFESKVKTKTEIWTAFIVTDFEKGFKSMTKSLNVKKTYQLYRDYLDNFRINVERN